MSWSVLWLALSLSMPAIRRCDSFDLQIVKVIAIYTFLQHDGARPSEE